MDSLDVDPFVSTSTSKRIDYLFLLSPATHRFLVRHAATLWTEEQQHRGRLTMAPPHIAALAARQQPKALAADETTRLGAAHLLGLISTVLASWVLLATLGSAHLMERRPTTARVTRDRRAELHSRPATLAIGPIDAKGVKRLGREWRP